MKQNLELEKMGLNELSEDELKVTDGGASWAEAAWRTFSTNPVGIAFHILLSTVPNAY